MRESIGEKLSPILEEIEATLLEYEEQELGQPLILGLISRLLILSFIFIINLLFLKRKIKNS